jgi:glucuronate isomerase
MGTSLTTQFINDDFLLRGESSRRLYHEYAKDQPIVDYHCHLSPDLIAEDHAFANLAEIWLHGDHYKWRAMRTNGVGERYVTGGASDWEKFQAWAATVPKCLRNPLYHWTHLELDRHFGIRDRLLNPESAAAIWEKCNDQLQRPELSARGILKTMRVKVVCTTDDPVDSLEAHAAIAADKQFSVQVRPTWRPDAGCAIDDPARFNGWVGKLERASGMSVGDFTQFLDALRKRHAFFHQRGCRLSDHGLDTVYADDYTDAEIKQIFAAARAGVRPTAEQAAKFKSAMLYEGALMDHRAGWVQQFHVGAMRNNNSRLHKELGPDQGFDSIGDFSYGKPLAKLLDRLDGTNQLAKTILYNSNPRDNALLATLIGNFQDGSSPGKMQFGSGWWFLDQEDGMRSQMEALSNMSLISRFVGMLTDSRSFMSYPRHDYFRRILCNLFGEDIDRGALPNDFALIGETVRDICYGNAARYFDFGLAGAEKRA